jgi:hypothetical protein
MGRLGPGAALDGRGDCCAQLSYSLTSASHLQHRVRPGPWQLMCAAPFSPSFRPLSAPKRPRSRAAAAGAALPLSQPRPPACVPARRSADAPGLRPLIDVLLGVLSGWREAAVDGLFATRSAGELLWGYEASAGHTAGPSAGAGTLALSSRLVAMSCVPRASNAQAPPSPTPARPGPPPAPSARKNERKAKKTKKAKYTMKAKRGVRNGGAQSMRTTAAPGSCLSPQDLLLQRLRALLGPGLVASSRVALLSNDSSPEEALRAEVGLLWLCAITPLDSRFTFHALPGAAVGACCSQHALPGADVGPLVRNTRCQGWPVERKERCTGELGFEGHRAHACHRVRVCACACVCVCVCVCVRVCVRVDVYLQANVIDTGWRPAPDWPGDGSPAAQGLSAPHSDLPAAAAATSAAAGSGVAPHAAARGSRAAGWWGGAGGRRGGAGLLWLPPGPWAARPFPADPARIWNVSSS